MFAMIGYFVMGNFNQLSAQIYCQGPGCSSLPINSDDMNRIYTALQTNYLNEVLDDMSTANAYALVNTIPGGVVNLNEFTIGLGISVAQTEVRKIDVFVPDYGTLEDVPSVGVGLIPSLFIGMNLGYVFSSKPTLSKLPWYSIHRFDLYLSYLKSSIENKDYDIGRKNESWIMHGRTTGIELRYHLAEGDKDISYLFGFSGVSVGVGYHQANYDLKYKLMDYKVVLNAAYNTDLTWKADNEVNYNNKMDAYTLDIRTGIQLLYFFRFSIGAGNAWLKGSSKFQFQRLGPVTVSSDYLTLLGYNAPTSYLGILLEGSGSPKQKSIAYLTLGLELNIPVFKIFIDVKGTKDIYSGSVGVRMSL
jgi:hypothetical protein